MAIVLWALALATLSLAAADTVRPQVPADLAERLHRARVMLEAEEFPQVLEVTKVLLREVRTASGPESDATAEAIALRVRALSEAGFGSGAQVLPLAERGLAIRERLRGPDDPALADSLEARSDALTALTEDAGALADLRRALEIRERAFGPDSVEVARTLLSTAESALWNQGTGDEPARLVERAVAIIDRTVGPRSAWAGYALHVKALVLKVGSKYEESRTAYEESLRILEQTLPPDHPWIGTTLTSFGHLLVDTEESLQARSVLERAVTIVEKRFPASGRLSWLLSGLGAAQADCGDLQEAIVTLSRNVTIADHVQGATSFSAGVARNRLAVAHLMAGEFAAGVPLSEQAVAILESKLGSDDRETLAARNNLGTLLLNMGKYSEARPQLEKTYIGAARSFGAESLQRADIASSLADLELTVGNVERAGTLYSEAQAIRVANFGPGHRSVASVMTGLARVDLVARRPAAALDRALKAERIARDCFQATARALTEREALQLEAIRVSGLDLALSALQDTIPTGAGPPAMVQTVATTAAAIRQVWDALVHSRALVLDEMTTRRRALIASGEDAQAAMERLTQAASRLAHLTATTGGDAGSFASRLQAAQDEQQAAERALAEVSLDFRRFHDRSVVGLPEVLRSLPPGTALLGYVRFERPRPPSGGASVAAGSAGVAGRDRKIAGVESFAAFVAPAGGGDPAFVPLGPGASIREAIAAWRAAIAVAESPLAAHGTAAEQRYRIAAGRLRRLMWDPVSHLLGGSQRVFIIPDGPLSLLSFATLPTGPDRYLAESGPTIHYLSAERDVVTHCDVGPVGHGVLAVGDPDFDAAPQSVTEAGDPIAAPSIASRSGSLRSPRASCADLHNLRFTPLPAARLEAEELAKLWRESPGAVGGDGGGDVLIRLGARATEAAVKREAPGRRIVHLATHAYFASGDCAWSLGGPRAPRAALTDHDSLGLVGDNPLLLSGLALAGANHREEAGPEQEDGILTGEEIASLDLTGTQWVVLSACETGVGTVQDGEGILGLRRAFETAGAQTLIMSLWPVEDESARQWMRALYSERLAGQSTAESVRGAERAILDARRTTGKSTHPFFWGGFIAAGDWH